MNSFSILSTVLTEINTQTVLSSLALADYGKGIKQIK